MKCLFLAEPEHSINIPSYIIRGAGMQTHVEYEIRIFLADDRWLLLRRFSRFRELHLSMKALYGEKVSVPSHARCERPRWRDNCVDFSFKTWNNAFLQMFH